MRLLPLLVGFSVVLSKSAFAQSETVDLSSPESCAKGFVNAVYKMTFPEIASYVHGAKADAKLKAMIDPMTKNMPSIVTDVANLTCKWGSSLTGVSATQDNADRATVEFDFKLTFLQSGKPGETIGPYHQQLDLRKDSGLWRIIPARGIEALKGSGQNPPPNFIAQMAASIADPSLLTGIKQDAIKATCLSNVKQVCTGLLLLAADNNDSFKVTSSNWTKQLHRYIQTHSILRCPLDVNPPNSRGDQEGIVSYTFNDKLVGASEQKVKEPGRTVLVYEGRTQKLNFRHGGKACVGFVDGHAKLIDAEEAKKLLWR